MLALFLFVVLSNVAMQQLYFVVAFGILLNYQWLIAFSLCGIMPSLPISTIDCLL